MSESEDQCDGESTIGIKRKKTIVCSSKVSKRKTGPPCRCHKKCYENLSEEKINNILTKMNSFKDKNSQDSYLQSLIEAVDIKRERKYNVDNPKVRAMNFRYHISIGGIRNEVCKNAFLSLHGVGEKHVRRLNHLLIVDAPPIDMRGKSVKSRHNVIPGSTCSLIKEHIESFKTNEIHYSNHIKKIYLFGELDVKQMYELFKTKYTDSDVKYKFYLKYFKENFNYKFGRPQIDVCSTCEELNQKIKNTYLNENGKRVAAAELVVHKNRANKFYKKMQTLKEVCQTNENILAITIDYMQNLPLPHIPVQEVFYYRQLWVFVFCIHNIKTGKAYFYSYHEGQALKGPNEVCSFLHNYFLTEVPPNVKELHIFSDGCSGQNKNNTVIRFLLATASSGRFDKIFHYFPIRGHSFLPCDRDFGTAKRLIRKKDRIYTPDEYNELITKASKNFKIIQIKNEDILEFKNWWPEYYKKTTLSVRSTAKIPKDQKISFQILQYMEFEYAANKPGTVVAYKWIDGLIKEEFKLGKPSGVTPLLPTTSAYSGKISINSKKIEDVKKLIQYIPEEKKNFWNEIFKWPTTNQDENPEEDF